MKRAALRARIEATRDARRRRRRSRALKLILLLILLWLLMRRCDTGLVFVPLTVPTPGVGKSVPTAAPTPVEPARRARKSPRKRMPRVQTKPRAIYAPTSAGPALWLSALRMQVAARSPRLARCFEGQGEPGTLTWTTRLDPGTGIASDHAFEPRSGGALSADVRACLTAVLSAPAFELGSAEGARARVSLVIEF